jgi:hypothetical protein
MGCGVNRGNSKCLRGGSPMSLEIARLTQGWVCGCCGQIHRPSFAFQRIHAVLFTAEPFSICPVCESEVAVSICDPAYSRRIAKALTTNLVFPEIRKLMLLAYLFGAGSKPGSDCQFVCLLRELQGESPDKSLLQLTEAGQTMWNCLRNQSPSSRYRGA